MKKTQKRVLGLCGLTAVVAMTAVAATLPWPDASAVETGPVTSVTDTIQLRVVGDKPNVDILSPQSGVTVVSPSQTITFTYEDVGLVTTTVIYTDPDGVEHRYIVAEDDYDYVAGTYTMPLNLAGEGYGYGHYRIEVYGDGFADGAFDSDVVEFGYYPASASIEETPGAGSGESGTGGEGTSGEGGGSEGQNAIGGDYTIHFGYDTESGMGTATEASILITDLSNVDSVKEIPITPFPTNDYRLKFADYGLPSGTYKITVRIFYQYNGKTYYIDYTYTVTYKASTIAIPDTGGLFGNINIAKTDYLVTGLLIFGIVGVCGFTFIVRNNKKTVARKRRR